MTPSTTPEKTLRKAAREKTSIVSPCPPPDLGFHFTEDELRRIENAGRQAEIEMRTFGASYSRQPRLLDMDAYNTPYEPPKPKPEPVPKFRPILIEFHHVTKQDVLNVVAAEYGMKHSQVYEIRRRHINEARQMMSYILFWHLRWRKLHIAEEFKLKHPAIMNAINRISDGIYVEDKEIIKHYKSIMDKLKRYERKKV